MLEALSTYLSSLPADHAATATVLGFLSPVVLFLGFGMGALHAADVSAERSWRQ